VSTLLPVISDVRFTLKRRSHTFFY